MAENNTNAPLIETSAVGFTYQGSETPALQDVTLSIGAGECVLLCGKSGSGKTTFTRLLNGLAPAFFPGRMLGSCRVGDLLAGTAAIEEYVPLVGSVFQNPKTQYFNVDTTAELAFPCENVGMPSAEIRSRVQDFARKNDQIKYYYFTWSRLILYYTKQAQYTLAQYELEQYMSQAEKDNYKPATAEAYKQLGHIYRTRGLKKPAVEYYRKAIDFIIQNGLNTFHLSNLYSELATMLMDLQRYPEAAEAVEKGKACIPLPDYIWGLKAKETHLLAQTGQTDKAKALFNEIKAGQNGNLSEIKLAEIEVAIYNHSHEYGKMIAAIEAKRTALGI